MQFAIVLQETHEEKTKAQRTHGLSAVTKVTAFMSYSKLIKILRQTETKSGTGQRFLEKETDSRAQIVIGPKAEMVVTQRAKNAS